MDQRKPDRTDHPVNWVELKEHMEVRFAELVRHYDFRLNTIDNLRQKQGEELERRLAIMDEVQRTKYPTREDIALIVDRFAADIRTLRESRASSEGKASTTSFYLTLAVAIGAFIVALIHLFVSNVTGVAP